MGISLGTYLGNLWLKTLRTPIWKHRHFIWSLQVITLHVHTGTEILWGPGFNPPLPQMPHPTTKANSQLDYLGTCRKYGPGETPQRCRATHKHTWAHACILKQLSFPTIPAGYTLFHAVCFIRPNITQSPSPASAFCSSWRTYQRHGHCMQSGLSIYHAFCIVWQWALQSLHPCSTRKHWAPHLADCRVPERDGPLACNEKPHHPLPNAKHDTARQKPDC